MMEKIINVDVTVDYSIVKELGKADIKTDQIFREFIDNTTSNYFDHKQKLEAINPDKKCHIDISWNDEQIIIQDDAFGMNEEEFQRALRPNAKAEIYSKESRGKYGLGMKYAISALGTWYKIESTAYGSNEFYSVEVDIEKAASEKARELPVKVSEIDKNRHGTKIVIKNLKRKLDHKLGVKVKKSSIQKTDELLKRLASIYKHDIENQVLEIRINKRLAKPVQPEYLKKESGGEYWSSFEGNFEHGGKSYEYCGWLGVLKVGNVSEAGFSLIQRDRAIQINYRPESLFGKSNDFRYQRIIGEIILEGDSWAVTFTKDAVQWDDDGLQEMFIQSLNSHPQVRELLKVAKEYRKRSTAISPSKVDSSELIKTFNTNQNSDKQDKIQENIPTLVVNNDTDNNKTKELNPDDLVEVPFSYNGKKYLFKLSFENDEDSIKKFLRVTVEDSESNSYCLHINDTVPMFENFTKKETKALITKVAISLALSALECEKKGLELAKSNMFIEQLNEIMNKVKPEE